MNSEIYNILERVSVDLDLVLVETTTGSNGYPRNLWYSLIGFKNDTHFEEAQEALSKALSEYKNSVDDDDDDSPQNYSVTGQVLEKRDGHDLWTVDQETFPILINFFDMRSIKDDDNSVSDIFTAEDAGDDGEFVDSLKAIIDGMTSFNDISKVVDRYEKYKEVIEELEANQILVIDSSGNYEVLPKLTSSYHEDVTTYSIALTIAAE